MYETVDDLDFLERPHPLEHSNTENEYWARRNATERKKNKVTIGRFTYSNFANYNLNELII